MRYLKFVVIEMIKFKEYTYCHLSHIDPPSYYNNSSIQLPALHNAAKSGKIADIINLVKVGENVNSVSSDRGQSPLHYAAISRHIEAIQILINLGIDVDIRNEYGETARDLLRHTPNLQNQFDQSVQEFRQRNINIIAEHITDSIDSNIGFPHLPEEICELIAQYEGGFDRRSDFILHEEEPTSDSVHEAGDNNTIITGWCGNCIIL